MDVRTHVLGILFFKNVDGSAIFALKNDIISIIVYAFSR